ncbi:hypothetical protein IQ07DRAFT_246129 [Pyrenochaeta sp. DS3sAY3a]|nr:hypothetical protein IQ07DRAFT_246129 [Pyrenochaeta sp. DS3sAY3a]
MFYPLSVLIATWLAKKAGGRISDVLARHSLYMLRGADTMPSSFQEEKEGPPKEAIVHTRWLQPQSLGGTCYSLYRKPVKRRAKNKTVIELPDEDLNLGLRRVVILDKPEYWPLYYLGWRSLVMMVEIIQYFK